MCAALAIFTLSPFYALWNLFCLFFPAKKKKLLHGFSATLLALPSPAVFVQACNCRPSPALLITTVISIIAACYPRAQATLGRSDLSSPSFLSRTLSLSAVLVCRLDLLGKELLAVADRSHPSSFTRCHFHHFFCFFYPVLPSAALFFGWQRAHNSPAFIPAKQKPPACLLC
jgi:hypothetical protein